MGTFLPLQDERDTHGFDGEAGRQFLVDLVEAVGEFLTIFRGDHRADLRAQHANVVLLQEALLVQLHAWTNNETRIALTH